MMEEKKEESVEESKKNDEKFGEFRKNLKNLASMSVVDLLETVVRTYWKDLKNFLKK